MTDIEARLRRLEDLRAIDDLVALYGFTTDDRDVDGLRALFTEDAIVGSTDGVMRAEGVDAIMEQFFGRWAVLGPSNHFTHDRVVSFDEHDQDRATGLVGSHAEMTRNGEPRLAAIRYVDEYRRGADGRWRFRDRQISWFYYCAPDELGATLGEVLRVKAYAEPIAAGWPESLPTWRAYYDG